MHLAAGTSALVTLPIRLADLARYDPAANAYVVDGGRYTFLAAGCVANPALRDIHHQGDPTCPFKSAIYGADASFGHDGVVYGVYV